MGQSLRGVWVSLALAPAVFAQLVTTTSLVGTVADSSGQVVPGAAVTAVNTATKDTYNTITNGQGYYSIQFIRVGNYDLSVAHAGFQTSRKTGITVDINQVVRNDFVLQVGEVIQTVEVSAGAPPISTDDASISEVISQRAVQDLPLNGRDALKLAITTPGVVVGLKDPNGVPPGEDFIGAGTREIQNSVSLDGISILNNLITTTSLHPNVDAVQEFQVQTGTYSAQYGSYMGVHMNLITKSGTNALHGSLFEFLRNDKLDARGFFEDPNKPKNPLRQNQFGFELGGPVVIPHIYSGRDKTFFMGSYEGLRQVRNSSALDTVPTPKMRSGDLSEIATQIHNPALPGNPAYSGNLIPASQISPAALAVLQYIPLPNRPGISNNYLAVLPSNNTTDQSIDRIDQNIGNNIRFFFRYTWQDTTLLSGATNVWNNTSSPVTNKNFAFGYTHTLTPRLVNDFRVGKQKVNTASLNTFASNGNADAGAKLGIPGFDGDVKFGNPGVPDFNLPGYMGLGNGGTNWYQDDATWQGSDTLSYTRGAHNLIAGAELRKLITGRAAVNSPRGIFSFTGGITGSPVSDFLLGLPLQVTTPGPEVRGVAAEWRDGFFVLDNWQATRQLTLNLGLRYELPTVPYSVNGYHTLLNPQQTSIIPANPPVPGFQFIQPNHSDWAPRFGLAYRLTDNTVVRSGYGIYYNPNQTNSFTFLNTNPPFSPVFLFTSQPASPTLSLANPTPVGSERAAGPPNVITDNPNLPTAYMNQWSLDVERGLWSNAALDVQYLGSHSLHLDRSYYNNTPLPGTGAIDPRRPNQLFRVIRTIQNDEIANYEGLNVVLRQRQFHGLTMLLSYTWSHTLDVSTDSNGGGAPMNPYDWRADYANANWDIRHRFVGSYVYDLPFFRKPANPVLKYALGDWQVNGITVLQGGIPFNVTIPSDLANTGVGNQRPALVGAVSAHCGQGGLVNCIDAAGFAMPAQYTYGNAGRNLLRGPHMFDTDLSLFKNFPLSERARFQFRAEFFNVFNTPAFANPRGVFGTSSFGSVTSTVANNREIQFGAKLLF